MNLLRVGTISVLKNRLPILTVSSKIMMGELISPFNMIGGKDIACFSLFTSMYEHPCISAVIENSKSKHDKVENMQSFI